MESAKKLPEGPDFSTEGLALTDLANGAMVLGHVNNDPILMIRRGENIFAVSAKCTHYGGPLVKGLLVDDTVRCPWHHACFDIRTGEAVRAPALDPLACWTVERRNNRIYVADKHERDPLAPARPDRVMAHAQPASVGIIGGGAAGGAAAEMLRREGYQGRIVMFDNDKAAPYDRPNLSKGYLAGDLSPEQVQLRPNGFYGRHGIELVRAIVRKFDAGTRRVDTEDGTPQQFDMLLLATGAEPLALDIPGHDLPHVYVLRSLADSNALIAMVKQARCAVIMGASFIGLEVAASLRKRGLEVHIVAPDPRPLAKVLGVQLGTMVQKLHEQHGVVFHLGQSATSIEESTVVLENGERLQADMVVVGIGVQLRLGLAKAAGLKLDHGVSVDEYLQTSSPGIFAAGDIARWPDPHTGERIRVEHWVMAQRQGQTAARNILGARKPFDDLPFFWSKHYDLSIRYTGHAENWNRIDIDGDIDEQKCSVAYRRDQKTLAVASVKRDLQNLEAEVAMEENDEAALRQMIAPCST